jgi:hypothetical protein
MMMSDKVRTSWADVEHLKTDAAMNAEFLRRLTAEQDAELAGQPRPSSMFDPMAELLHDYFAFRAAKEGEPYKLDPDFFRIYLEMGVSAFFGVRAGVGCLVCDDQQPGIFEELKATKAAA